MTAPEHQLIACDLGALSSKEREREQVLLGQFRALCGRPEETETGFRFVLPMGPEPLSQLGEFLALERLCCPFLNFDLTVPAGRGPVTLHVRGGPGVKPFIRSVFFGER
jgi:hypothetical protein